MSSELPTFDSSPVPQVRSNAPTWRYIGERDAADLAYCRRFAVSKAPEPSLVVGGILAYALPEVTSSS
jgi:hypothetical protein